MPSHQDSTLNEKKSAISIPENASFFAKEVFKSFQERASKNSRYSLRAFSRSLGISPSWLLRMLKNEREPSVSMVNAIATKLAWSKTVRDLALREIVNSVSTRKLNAVSDPEIGPSVENTRWLEDDEFFSVADPISLAMLELSELSDFLFTPRNAAAELGISVDEAGSTIERLVESGNLESRDDGTYRKANAWMHTKGRDRTTAEHRALVKLLLAHASAHVSETPWGERLNYWGMYAIDPDEIPKLKPIIERFLIDIESVLAGKKRKKVYTAGFYLCPAKAVSLTDVS